MVVALALGLAPSPAQAYETGAKPNPQAPAHDARAAAPRFIDLGTVRYLSPTKPKELWLGLDIGGVYMPANVIANFGRDIWTARAAFPWALALTPWLSVGGRHELAWYDAENVRAQYSNQEVSIALSPTTWRTLPGVTQDRLEFGFEAHDMFKTTLFGDDGLRQVLHLGGIFDRVLYMGYGMSHRVRPKLACAAAGLKLESRTAHPMSAMVDLEELGGLIPNSEEMLLFRQSHTNAILGHLAFRTNQLSSHAALSINATRSHAAARYCNSYVQID